MTADNRSTSAPWLLPPIALQILHYLDDADDAHAFLQAAPNDSLDDALDALRTLLAMDVELPLWPTAHIAGPDEAYTSVFATALPLFKTITVTSSQNNCKICHATELPPTTALSATVEDGVISVRAALGDWLPRLVDLKVMSGNDLNAVALIKDDLSACHDLRALTMNQEDGLGQDAFDAALTAVIATCPQVERICVGSSSLSYMSDCKHLVAWLALPSARHLKVECTDFQDELGAELAVAMLTSTTLETIELSEVPNLTRAILCPSSPPMPSQLQHLTICDCMTTGGYDSWDDGNNTTVDPPSAFDESNVVDVATKISTASSLKSLDLWSRTSCDATPVVNILPQLPTLTKLALQDVHLAAFPSLRQLWHLELWWVSFSDDAIASLATLLCSSPKLVHLDLRNRHLPDHQTKAILSALPDWLSRRGTACDVRLTIKSDACAVAFVTALAQTRNTHMVKLTIAVHGLSLDAKKQLVAALGSTTRMALTFAETRPAEDAVLEAYGRQHHLTFANRTVEPGETKKRWYFSPRTTTC